MSRFALLLLFVSCLNRSSDDNSLFLPRVIVVTLSGVRNQESLDTSDYMPFFHSAIMNNGTLFTNLVPTNYEFHMPANLTILTGADYSCYDSRMSLEKMSIFQMLKRKYNLRSDKMWAFGLWSKDLAFKKFLDELQTDYPIQVVPLPSEFSTTVDKWPSSVTSKLTNAQKKFIETYSSLSSLTWPPWDSFEDFQFSMLLKSLEYAKPMFVHYVMSNPETAHYDSFASYVISLRDSDDKIRQIFEYINKDPYYKGNTFLIVNIDHPRDTYYMEHNEHTSASPGKVWAFVMGPDIPTTVHDSEINHYHLYKMITDAFKLNPDEFSSIRSEKK